MLVVLQIVSPVQAPLTVTLNALPNRHADIFFIVLVHSRVAMSRGVNCYPPLDMGSLLPRASPRHQCEFSWKRCHWMLHPAALTNPSV